MRVLDEAQLKAIGGGCGDDWEWVPTHPQLSPLDGEWRRVQRVINCPHVVTPPNRPLLEEGLIP
jgi:hypothetical protein